jgi:EF-hand domain-containing family member B
MQGAGAKECVANLMHGAHSAQEQLPDADLGKSLRQGYRNIPPPGIDPNRAYGVPSVRTDLHLRTRHSIANAQNYGNEPDAMALLSPCSTADRGVNEDTYSQKRTAEDIRHLLDSTATIRLPDAEFNEVFQTAAEQEGCDGSMCTLMAFMSVRHKRLHQQVGL